MGLIQYIIVEHIWVLGTLMIPVSLVYDAYLHLWTTIINSIKKLTQSKQSHDEKVAGVQEQVRNWIKSGSKKAMCTARPGWKSVTLQVCEYKDRMHQINIDLKDIIFIDEKEKYCRVEPSVTIGELNDSLMKKGWMLPIVPELDDLTIGGLVMGGGIETTSNKFGLFHNICRAYEMVLADGSKMWTSADNEPELYCTIPFSYGTLGFLTGVDLDIVPYKPYIEMTYLKAHSLKEMGKELDNACKDPKVDSVEGLMYSKDSAIIMLGKFVDSVPSGACYNDIGRYYKPWFYKHVKGILDSSDAQKVEYMPSKSFYHRHNKCFFWLMSIIVPFGNNPVFRWLFGWSLPPHYSLIKLIRHSLVPKEELRTFVVQDYLVKLTEFEKSMDFFHNTINVYPVWLCPLMFKVNKGLEKHWPLKNNQLYIDIGLYGDSQLPDYNPYKAQRACENFCIENGGLVALYAETYLTKDEHAEMFYPFLHQYEKMRKKFKCEPGFCHVYDKISKNGRKGLNDPKYEKME